CSRSAVLNSLKASSSTIQGENTPGAASTAASTFSISTHAKESTSSGLGSNVASALSDVIKTGQISFSTIPEESTARYAKSGSTTSGADKLDGSIPISTTARR